MPESVRAAMNDFLDNTKWRDQPESRSSPENGGAKGDAALLADSVRFSFGKASLTGGSLSAHSGQATDVFPGQNVYECISAISASLLRRAKPFFSARKRFHEKPLDTRLYVNYDSLHF